MGRDRRGYLLRRIRRSCSDRAADDRRIPVLLQRAGCHGEGYHGRCRQDGLHDQFLYAKGSGAKVDKNGFTFVDLEAGIYRGTSKTFFGDVSLATFGIVNCAVGAYLSEEPKIEASVLASIYTMSYSNTVSFFDWDINISANLHYGAISAGGGFDLKEKKFKFAPPMIGIAGDFTIDFD